jgi:hypothetical protein
MAPALLLEDELDLTIESPEFESLAALELAGTEDEDAAGEFELSLAIADAENINAGMLGADGELDAATLEVGELPNNSADLIIAETGQAISDGNTILGDYERDLDPARTGTGGVSTGTPVNPHPGNSGGGSQCTTVTAECECPSSPEWPCTI